MGYNNEIDKIGKMLRFHPDEVSLYREKGKVGVRNTDGSVFYPAQFDQIEVCEKYVYFFERRILDTI